MKPHFLSRNRTVLVGDLLFIIVCVLGSFVLRVPFGARLYDFRYQILTMIGGGITHKTTGLLSIWFVSTAVGICKHS